MGRRGIDSSLLLRDGVHCSVVGQKRGRREEQADRLGEDEPGMPLLWWRRTVVVELAWCFPRPEWVAEMTGGAGHGAEDEEPLVQPLASRLSLL